MFSKFVPTLTIATLAMTATLAVAPTMVTADQVRDHRTKVTVRDHRTPTKNEIVVVGQGDKDCRSGAVKLHKMGYSRIRSYDCEGAVFHYGATDGFALFRAAMSSHSGAMRVEFIGLLGQ